jgi:hypothetical protein
MARSSVAFVAGPGPKGSPKSSVYLTRLAPEPQRIAAVRAT